jgi:hypothetical protein
MTLSRGGNEHDWPAAPFRLRLSRFPSRVPGYPGLPEIEVRRAQIFRAWSLGWHSHRHRGCTEGQQGGHDTKGHGGCLGFWAMLLGR